MYENWVKYPDIDVAPAHATCISFLSASSISLAEIPSGPGVLDPFLNVQVKCTFKKGSNTPGPDGISARMIDEADRKLMHGCLSLLWNRAWSLYYFVTVWKLENRIVFPKQGKENYNECNSYRTVSITSCLGKRFEHIISRRLFAVLDQLRFDLHQ